MTAMGFLGFLLPIHGQGTNVQPIGIVLLGVAAKMASKLELAQTRIVAEFQVTSQMKHKLALDLVCLTGSVLSGAIVLIVSKQELVLMQTIAE